MLYVADRDGGTSPTDASVAVIRRFNMQTGAPAGDIRVTGPRDSTTSKWPTTARSTRRRRASADRNPDPQPASLEDHPRRRCLDLRTGRAASSAERIAFDPQGNIVVITSATLAVLTFSPAGQLVKNGNAVQPGNDGLVIMPDGTKYVSSRFQNGGRLPHPDRSPRGAHRAEHSESRVHVLRRRGESARDSDEREQRARVHPAELEAQTSIVRSGWDRRCTSFRCT